VEERRESVERDPEFRIGDYEHELGIIDRRFTPPDLAADPGGVLVYWHVDDVAAALDRLVSLGARQLEGVRPRVRHRLGRRPVRQHSGDHVQAPLPRHPGRPRMSKVGHALRSGSRVSRKPAVNEAEVIEFRDAAEFEAWLDAHVDLQVGVWLKIAKTGSGVPSLTADEAVDDGLCYGWISGQRKSYDDVHYLQKYVPRRPRSRWSQVNVAKVEELIAAGGCDRPAWPRSRPRRQTACGTPRTSRSATPPSHPIAVPAFPVPARIRAWESARSIILVVDIEQRHRRPDRRAAYFRSECQFDAA
jgi:hypothetical protein